HEIPLWDYNDNDPLQIDLFVWHYVKEVYSSIHSRLIMLRRGKMPASDFLLKLLRHFSHPRIGDMRVTRIVSCGHHCSIYFFQGRDLICYGSSDQKSSISLHNKQETY